MRLQSVENALGRVQVARLAEFSEIAMFLASLRRDRTLRRDQSTPNHRIYVEEVVNMRTGIAPPPFGRSMT